MDTLELSYSEIFQGDFTPAERNILLVFQVNCPGCFLYALPIAIGLHKDLKDHGVKVMGLSTAFEDFSLNTPENTRALLENNTLVGETQKAFAHQDIQEANFELDFPIAFDRLLKPDDFSDQDFENLAQIHPQYTQLSEHQKPLFTEQVKNYYKQQEFLPETFTKNQLAGTPSWLIFNKQGEILYQTFGHQLDLEQLQTALKVTKA